jgi:hypothetical protein
MLPTLFEYHHQSEQAIRLQERFAPEHSHSSAWLSYRIEHLRSLWLPGLMALLGYIGSLWEWLAFQHSLSFGKELNFLAATPIKPDDRLITLKLTDHNIDGLSGSIETKRVVSVLYCPKCGTGE